MTLGFRLNPVDQKLPVLHVIHLVDFGLQLCLLSIKRQ
jgi:hypothetical protein